MMIPNDTLRDREGWAGHKKGGAGNAKTCRYCTKEVKNPRPSDPKIDVTANQKNQNHGSGTLKQVWVYGSSVRFQGNY